MDMVSAREGRPSGARHPRTPSLPVLTDLLLVGRRPGFALPEGFDFNTEPACLSHALFLTVRNDSETERLHRMVGSKLLPPPKARAEAQTAGAPSVSSRE